MAEHTKIHIIELSKWNKSQIEDDLDLWTHFFKDGKAFSIDGLPNNMLTQEMEEAELKNTMQDLHRFENKLEQFENKLEQSEMDLSQLRQSSEEKDKEIEKLKQQLMNK